MCNIVIATSTLYQSMTDVRAQLALQVISEAKNNHFPIVVVDDSPESVTEAFLNSEAIVLKQTPNTTMGAGRRQAISKAAELAGEDGWVVWMEPEKIGFIDTLEDMISFRRSVDLIIPERRHLTSYPYHQQHAEKLGNEAFRLLTGRDLDMWFGPRVFKTPIASFFLDYNGEYGDKWDSIFIPVIRAMKAGVSIDYHVVEFYYPPQQRREEEKSLHMLRKRIDQLTTLIDALEKEWNKPA